MAENEQQNEPNGLDRDCAPNTLHGSEMLISKTQLMDLIDDDVYKILRRHFLMTGKGRRPVLPPVFLLTNWLLVQLTFLKDEANTTFAQMKLWLQKLFPVTANISESRMYHRVNFLFDSCLKLGKDDVISLLQECHDFQALPPPLAALQLSRLHLINVETYHQPPSVDVTNDVVIALERLRAQEGETPMFVRKWVCRLSAASQNLSESQLKTKVKATLNKYKNFPRYKKDALTEFLGKPFIGKAQEASPSGTITLTCQQCSIQNNVISEKEKIIRELTKDNKSLTSSNCILKEEVKVKSETMLTLQSLNKDLETVKDEVKILKHQLKAEATQTCLYKEELNTLKRSNFYKQNYKYKRQLEEMEKKEKNIGNECASLQLKVRHLQKKLKSEQTCKSNYKQSYTEQKKINSDLSKMLMADDNDIKIKEDGSSHRFSDDIRKTFYALQGEGNVAASNCSNVIATVAKTLFKKDLSHLPSNSTSLNFINEAHVVAKQQVVDEIKHTDFFTYAHDGTSREKSHYLEQHLHLSNGKILSLGFSEIASDDSETLLEKCVSSFKDLYDIYTLDQNVDENEFLKEIIKKMKCLMSDRAAVCKAFDAKMAAFKNDLLGGEDSTTHFLFCNAHFLLALSRSAEEGVCSFEEQFSLNGEKLGRDTLSSFANWDGRGESAAVRLIRLAADVLGPRGDEKSGCRQEWLAYLSAKGKKSTFCSYRNNRFNNLFQNATAVLKHKDDIETFLTDYVSHNNLKLQSVLADVQDGRIISSIVVISFLHILLTEPYWLLMNSRKNYSDFSFYVKEMKAAVDAWVSSSFNPLTATSVFLDFKAKEDDRAVLDIYLHSDSFHMSLFKNCFSLVISKCNDALKRQLADFLDGGLFDEKLLDESVKTILSKCPLTNLVGERLFGDLDFCMKKRRNASLHTRTTSNMWKHNKTAHWLRKQSPSMSQKLVKKAIRFGPEWRQRYRDQKKAVFEKVKARIVENKNQKDAKDVKKKEKKLAAIEAILEYGTLVNNKGDLDSLYSGPKALEKLKDQIRYRALVKGEKISMTGTKKVLYERLLQHISKSNAETTNSLDITIGSTSCNTGATNC